REAGYRDIEAYTPFPVEGLAEALGFARNRVPLLTLIGGILGGAGAYFVQWYSAVIDYPINAGGRALHSWPAFIVPTFELAILGAALAAFFGFILLNGLPRLHHPVFNAPDFDLASKSRFFLCIRLSDPRFDAEATERLLRELQPVRVMRVER
ncbi:MAG TPA: DUF3341 domain-containing protein, partial [Casimicrobiaceae bacterium]|nr:DUF3341 domain-containing protein [Casimicrobiaceae bacterium]